MTAREHTTLRCAIYTRKSSEEGLEQEFNSLEAQREACEAYIKSQAHEGWKAVPERFDDGGFSGGTMERPGLQKLLARIREKRVDVIVLYKIDRLTRSLMDFAKLAELLDKEGVSFVSVTQQFNTTTSMGRLMLNVLLSFAQFEREITGERIRDKIAASKKKGIFMGGSVPIGYDLKDRALVVNKAEAETVRTLYSLYLKLGNVRDVWVEAGRLGLKTKVRNWLEGRQKGGIRFFPGHIYCVLKSPIYVGRIPHKGETYPGNHEAIIETATWDAVQKHLAENRVGRRGGKRNAKNPSLLAGLLFDAKGNRYIATHASKPDRRYRYYVDQAVIKGLKPSTAKFPRIPAPEIENAVRKGLADFLDRPAELLKALGGNLSAAASDRALRAARKLRQALLEASTADWTKLVGPFLRQAIIDENAIRLQIARDGLLDALSLTKNGGSAPSGGKRKARTAMHDVVVPAQIRTRGNVMKLVIGNEGNGTPHATAPALIKAIARAYDWFERLKSGRTDSIRDLARMEGFTESYVTRVLRLAFLAPGIIEAVLDGLYPIEHTADRLTLHHDISILWPEQRRRLRFETV